ncbi:MAG: sulfotransferase family protein, partial [Gammaproteobacteria bacterium]|nr:sulfotransferase family protein [Gammaproteobacteria bacterium]
LQRSLDLWLPSIQMLLNKMQPHLNAKTYTNPILKRSFGQTFDLNNVDKPLDDLLDSAHLTACYQGHEQGVIDYFHNNNDNLLSIDVSQKDSLPRLLAFLGLSHSGEEQFPHLNMGRRVDSWGEFKHPNKVNANAAGSERRKFFDY